MAQLQYGTSRVMALSIHTKNGKAFHLVTLRGQPYELLNT
jgi:hypothetical protein